MNKVLAIAPYPYLPYFSGGQKFIARFLEWLGKEVQLTVISVEGNDFSMANSYKGLSWLKKSRSRYLDRSLIEKISTLIKEKGFDTLILEHPYFAWLAFAIRKRTGIKVIIHTHNIEYQRFRSTGRWWWPVLKNYERSAFRKADGILFISDEDRDFAVRDWNIDPGKCYELPFGIDNNKYPEERSNARQKIASFYNLNANEKILLFTGLLNYKPNADAVKIIASMIDPLLEKTPGFKYKIIICGKGLDKAQLSSRPSIIYAGFVENITDYYQAADIMLNPVLSGGGVKTKLVEAIAAGTTVISTETGAAGIDKSTCGNKLVVVPDNDWKEFTDRIIAEASNSVETPSVFYETYAWPNLIWRLVTGLSQKLAGGRKQD